MFSIAIFRRNRALVCLLMNRVRLEMRVLCFRLQVSTEVPIAWSAWCNVATKILLVYVIT